jgi:hypothetical protein
VQKLANEKEISHQFETCTLVTGILFEKRKTKQKKKKPLYHKRLQKQELLKQKAPQHEEKTTQHKRPNTNGPTQTAQHKRLLPQYAERSKKNGEKGSIEWG